MLGAAGLFHAYRAGNVVMANAPGTGVADDKAVYAFIPDIIRYFLGEEPILANVETHLCRRPEGLAFTLDNLRDLVVKEVGGSGGYGMLVGPQSTAAEREAYAARVRADPDNFISQPVLAAVAGAAVFVGGSLQPRHVDVRPFTLHGSDGQHVRARRAVPGGAAEGQPGGELQPGRRLQGPLGPAGLTRRGRPGDDARARGGGLLLDGPLPRADRTHRAAVAPPARRDWWTRPPTRLALGWRVVYRTLGQSAPEAPADADEAEAFLIADAYTLAGTLVEDETVPGLDDLVLADGAGENAKPAASPAAPERVDLPEPGLPVDPGLRFARRLEGADRRCSSRRASTGCACWRAWWTRRHAARRRLAVSGAGPVRGALSAPDVASRQLGPDRLRPGPAAQRSPGPTCCGCAARTSCTAAAIP